MSDEMVSTPEKPAPESARPDERSDSPRTRRYQSVRWLLSELLIVVVGVLIALSAQRWWQGREDRAREATYITELIADMRQTELAVRAADSLQQPRAIAAANALRAYRRDARPAVDSLAEWATRSLQFHRTVPVTATAEALISTGDARIIRDDSARRAIYDYLAASREYAVSQERFVDVLVAAGRDLTAHVDYLEPVARQMGPALDSIARSDPAFPLPPVVERTPFGADTAAFWRTEEIYEALQWVNLAHANLAGMRRDLLTQTIRSREILEAGLDE